MSPRVSTSWLTTSTNSGFAAIVQSIITGMTGNATFAGLAASLAAVVALSASYVTALAAARNGGKTETAAKDTARTALEKGLRTLGQGINDTATTLEEALSTNYPLQKQRGPLGIQPAPANLRLKHGKVSGSVACTSDGSDHRVMFEWQSALGENPVTWITEPSTNSASATLSEHVPGTWLNVRVRIRVPAGAGDWSGVAKIMVV